MKTNKKEQQGRSDKKQSGPQVNGADPRKRKDPLNKNPSEFEDEEETPEEENERNRKSPVEEKPGEENEYQKEKMELPGVHQENTKITNAGHGRDSSQGSEFL